ncbi:MAG: hypothetical protein IKP46_04755 [Bacteroidales bacterium]|nr:hypothetical protein [Bacteroidales bacterium]
MSLLVILSLIFAISGEDRIREILILTGASSAEELDESVLERFEALESHPLAINFAPVSRLLSSGLFTAYQAASLQDYRTRCGDVLSVMELSLVDGFAGGIAEAMAPFVSFASRSAPGAPAKDTLIFHNDLIAKGSFRTGSRIGYGVKDRFSIGGRFECSAAYSPYGLRANATVYGRRRPWSLIAGDYNLRFGQGLSIWSGFSLSGIYGVSSLTKRPSGLSPSFSYSSPGSFRGLGASMGFARNDLTLFVATDSFRDISAGAAWSILFASGQAGVHVIGENVLRKPSVRVSADAAVSIRGWGLAGEVAVQALKGRCAGIITVSTPSFKGFKTGLRASVIPSGYSGKKNGEYGGALAAEYAGGRYVPVSGKEGFGSSEQRHKVVLSFEAASLPKSGDTSRARIKASAQYSFRLSSNFLIQSKVYTNLYTYQASRHGFRTELRSSFGKWSADARLEMVFSKRYGVLSYLEAGYTGKLAKGFFRVTGFAADVWADRVYAYERDIPGSFSAPAYYGRGVSLSAFGSCKFRIRRRFVLKAAIRGFLTMKKPVPWKAGLNVQGEFTF